MTSFLDTPKISLYGRKILCIDDEIYREETDRQLFTLESGLYVDDVFFADSFDSALYLLEKHQDISIIIADLRIPKNSKDAYDYNPENSEMEWGEELIKEIDKRYSKKREINIIVVSAYTIYSYTNQKKISSVLAFQEKPLEYQELTENLQTIISKYKDSDLDFSSLDENTIEYVNKRTQVIQENLQIIQESVFVIGQCLLEVKRRLEPEGQYLLWLKAKFRWTDRHARRYTSTFERFGDQKDRLSALSIDKTAYWFLVQGKTTDEAAEEVFALAETGQKISPKIVKQVRDKYIKTDQEIVTNSQNRDLRGSADSSVKQEILAVVRSQHAVQKSWWKLGENHKLFCGEPKNKEFITSLPANIALKVNFLPEEDFSLIPKIKSKSSLTFHSQYEDLDLDSLLDDYLKTTTKPKEVVVFNYIYYVELLEFTDKAFCNFIVAEPDINKCNEILNFWRKKVTVERIS